mgnify:CR=1 FL=1
MEKETLQTGGKPSLIKMIWSPGPQLDKIRENPKILGALIIVTLVFVLSSVFTAMGMTVDFLMDTGLSKEEAELLLGFTKGTAIATGFFLPVISILISSVIYLIIVKIAKKDVTFKQIFSMNVYISIIGAIGLLLNSFIQWAIGGNPEITITSIAGLLNSNSPILAQFEVFAIWQYIVTALGLQKVCRFSKGASWTIVIVLFIIGLLFGLIGQLFQGVAGV